MNLPASRDATDLRAFWIFIVAGSALLAIWLAVPGARAIAAALLAPLPPLGIFAGVHLFRPAQRRPWQTFGLGSAAIAAAVIGFALGDLFRIPIPTPSPLYGVLTVGLALELIGLVGIVRSRVRLGLPDVIDVSVLVTGLIVLAWFAIFDPVLHIGGIPGAQLATLLTYLVADIVFVVLISFLLMTPGRRPASFWFLLAAVIAVLASQLAFSYEMARGLYRAGSLANLGWQAACLLWPLAALHPSMTQFAAAASEPQAKGLPRGRFILIAGATLMPSLGLLLMADGGDPLDRAVIAIAGAMTLILVMLRLYQAIFQLGRSIAMREGLEDELREQALRDPLTGLGNRAMFTRQLELALRTDPTGVAVLFCDLDDFKAVNDTLGHGAGDDLLVATGERIGRALRPGDVIARLGGDEFGILLRGVREPSDAVGAAERILAVCREPLEIEGHTVYAGPSIGIAFGAPGSVAAETLRNADIAMYLAKSQGKSRYELFHPSLHAEVVSRLALRASLQHAIDAEEFVVHYQPLVDLATERTIGLEALVRWQHPERGLIPPAEFIPVAEATGLIVPLGRWVLDTACWQVADWVATGTADADLALNVNLSPAQLRHPDVVEHVRAALAASGLNPALLVLEVTEGAISDLDEAVSALTKLKGLGVQIAIDDFGTGYSALSYLSRFPINHVKIDRSFVSALGESERETTLTETVVRMATQLGLNTVAEGIESHEQLAALRALGCPQGQGFLFNRPMDVSAMERVLRGQVLPEVRRSELDSNRRAPARSVRPVRPSASDHLNAQRPVTG